MPWDEAAVKNYGGGGLRMLGSGAGAAALGTAGGAIGAAGGPLSIVGAAAGGLAGAEFGAKAMKPLEDRILPAYQTIKRAGKMTVKEAQQLARMYGVLSDPRYYLSQRRPPYG
jgi:phage tail tape-measure protein